MRDFWLNDRRNDGENNGDFKSWSYDGDDGEDADRGHFHGL